MRRSGGEERRMAGGLKGGLVSNQKAPNGRKFDHEQGQWHSVNQQTIKEFSSTGRLQECLKACQKVIQSEPESRVAWKYAGKSLLALGQFEKAQQCLTKAHQLDAQDPEIIKDIGNIFYALQNYAEAIKLYKTALSIDNEYAPAIHNLSLISKRQGDLKTAEQLAKRAYHLDQSSVPYQMNLSSIYKDLGNIEQALAFTLKSIELKPDNPDAHTNLGCIYKDLGNLDQALVSTLKSLELNPDNHTALMNLGGIYKDLGNLDEALAYTLKSLEIKPDTPTAHMNLGGLYKDLGNLEQALAYTLKSLELKPDNPDAHINLVGIYKDLGNLDQALDSTLKLLELKPDNPDALIKLGGIYKDLGNLDQALASTLKSLELKPEWPQALCKLGLIKMAAGQTKEAKKDLLTSIKQNDQECESYHALSTMLETTEEAEELIELMMPVKTSALPLQERIFAEFALSNCFHKIKEYNTASEHLQLANKYKSTAYPSNANILLEKIALSTSRFEATKISDTDSYIGKRRIFIVGMPRSGSTLLETILSINPEIKDLGESRSLEKAISKMQKQGKTLKSNHQNLSDLYSQFEPIDCAHFKYTTDKQLYNFVYINWIAAYMPAAKIIHCSRNPMDNILSMHRSNLATGNNYTANLEDAAKVLVAQEQAMQTQKKRYTKNIFTFKYDQFVNAPEDNLRKLLGWLDLEFNESYLQPEKSTRSVITASVMQARKPISNKSVGGWKNYETLLKPAFKIIQESGIKID